MDMIFDLLFGELFSQSLNLVLKKIKEAKIYNNTIYRKWIKTAINNNIEDDERATLIYNIIIQNWKDFDALNNSIYKYAKGDTNAKKNKKFAQYFYKTISNSIDDLSDNEDSFLRNAWDILSDLFYEQMPEILRNKRISNQLKILTNETNCLYEEIERLKHGLKIEGNKEIIIKDDTDKYIKLLKTKLFLEKDNNVNLDNLYIPAKFSATTDTGNHYFDLLETVIGFVSPKSTKYEFAKYYKTLFIFGKPGIGKSSFVSYIAKNKNKFPERTFIIRLRDLEPNMILQISPLSGISHYLNCENSDLRNSVLILDGLDEISAIYNRNFIKYIKELMNECNNKNIKLVITTREGYFDFDYELSNFASRVDISDWGKADLIKWMEKYTKYHPDLRNSINENIDTLNNSSYKSIFAIPILFYMANAKKIDIKKHQTIGALYDEIFKEVFDERRHDPALINNLDNLIGKNLSRQIAKEIAYSMHMSGQLIYRNSNDPYAEPESVSSALKRAFNLCHKKDNRSFTLEEKEKISELYALSFYYQKSNNTYSAVEFAHKTIAEYFISEKVIEMLLDINEENFNQTLYDCFCCKPITPIIFDFIQHKINLYQGTEEYNKIKDVLSKLFIKNCINGKIFIQDNGNYYSQTNVFNISTCLIKSGLKILFDLNFDARDITLNAEEINEFSMIIKNLSRIEEPYEDYKIHIPFYLKSFEFYNSYFSQCDFEETNFVDCNLSGAEFCDCNLKFANLSQANMDGARFDTCLMRNSYFNHIFLNRANFNDATLDGAHFDDVTVHDTKFLECSFYDSNIKNCNFFNTDFVGSDFTNAYLKDTNISESSINDTIWSEESVLEEVTMTDEQYNYIISQGAKIYNPNII